LDSLFVLHLQLLVDPICKHKGIEHHVNVQDLDEKTHGTMSGVFPERRLPQPLVVCGVAEPSVVMEAGPWWAATGSEGGSNVGTANVARSNLE